jgi:hypothetical protein
MMQASNARVTALMQHTCSIATEQKSSRESCGGIKKRGPSEPPSREISMLQESSTKPTGRDNQQYHLGNLRPERQRRVLLPLLPSSRPVQAHWL